MSIGESEDAGALQVILGGFSLVVTFGAWFGATVSIVNLMEAFSSFLHCLRLAWIEFNSKFFVAEGYPFQPLATEDDPGIKATSEAARSE